MGYIKGTRQYVQLLSVIWFFWLRNFNDMKGETVIDDTFQSILLLFMAHYDIKVASFWGDNN